MTVPGEYKKSDNDYLGFVSTPQNERLIAEMVRSHFVGDFCVVGEKVRCRYYSIILQLCGPYIILYIYVICICIQGTGKTVLINEFAHRLGYEIEPVMVYLDMTSRDLCQQRVTLPNGDTSWRLTPLVEAALKGRLALLDGINRLDMGTLAVLQRLVL